MKIRGEMRRLFSVKTLLRGQENKRQASEQVLHNVMSGSSRHVSGGRGGGGGTFLLECTVTYMLRLSSVPLISSIGAREREQGPYLSPSPVYRWGFSSIIQ